MRVWRVEDDAGRGPYDWWWGSEHPPYRHDGSSCLHPTPWLPGEALSEPGATWPTKEHNDGDERAVCGFESEEALHSWFEDSELYYLAHEGGYEVVVFEVPESSVMKGRRQVLFFRGDGEIVLRNS